MHTNLMATNRQISISQVRDEVNELLDQLVQVEAQYAFIRALDEAILNSGSSAEKAFNMIIEKGLQHTGAQHGQVVTFSRNHLIVTACSDPRRVGTELPMKGSLCGRAVRSGRDQHCRDIDELEKDEFVRFHRTTQSELVLLIRHKESDRILGLLSLERDQPGGFEDYSIRFAELLAGQAALAFEQARRWQSVELLYHVSTDLLSGDLSPGQAYQKILDATLETINFEHGQVLRSVGNELIIVASSRKDDLGLRLGPNSSVCGRYLLKERGQDLLRIPCVSESKYRRYYLQLLTTADEEPMRSEMIVPILDHGRLIGAINIESPQVDPFSEFDEKLLAVVRGLMAQAFSATLERSRLSSSHRTGAANLAMTQLGNVAQSYLHDFGSNIGKARGQLVELREHLSSLRPKVAIPQIAERTVEEFIDGIVSLHSSTSRTLEEFAERFNPNRARFHVEQLDLEEVVAACVQDFLRQRTIRNTEVGFQKRLPPEVSQGRRQIEGRAICDLTDQVRDVIANLLNNAVDAIEERRQALKEPELKGEVEVLLDLPDPLSARVRVSDNGIGIPKEQQEKVFSFGYTTKRQRSAPRGIGLSFCELYAYQQGGSIAVSSEPGQGSTFELIFPLVLS